ncbi:hypothetical protein OBBRIDRAFT_138927 [Obba rivulosa]|uniref:Uncharacterized protein n=1 Tax=Obba rivulosa TaxID=1052685 RepID=A0A8E2AVW0_9APHY|nr:hypothetical protein OBBRIDRAFT_138927 [Obba rivulosa]
MLQRRVAEAAVFVSTLSSVTVHSCLFYIYITLPAPKSQSQQNLLGLSRKGRKRPSTSDSRQPGIANPMSGKTCTIRPCIRRLRG